MGAELIIDQVNMIFGFKAKAVTALSGIQLEIKTVKSFRYLVRLVREIDATQHNGRFVNANHGKILVENEAPIQARLQRKFGIIFQAPTLLEWRNVIDNVWKLPS